MPDYLTNLVGHLGWPYRARTLVMVGGFFAAQGMLDVGDLSLDEARGMKRSLDPRVKL